MSSMTSIIVDSPEHHFLNVLDRIKGDATGWYGLHFSLSTTPDPTKLSDNLGRIAGLIRQMRDLARDTVDTLAAGLADSPDHKIYIFADGDVLALTRIAGHDGLPALKRLYDDVLKKMQVPKGQMMSLLEVPGQFQALADQKRITAKRIEAYQAMSDRYRRDSIRVRRDQRDEPLLLLVEDDRFTATYTMHLLGQCYDIVHVRSGEDAIIAYLEHAPDGVLMDIHMPGLNGNQTLAAIRAIDPEAFVVMLSVDTEVATVKAAGISGASAYLKKPFSRERLHAAVSKSPFVRDHSLAMSTALMATLNKMTPPPLPPSGEQAAG